MEVIYEGKMKLPTANGVVLTSNSFYFLRYDFNIKPEDQIGLSFTRCERAGH
jgi:hypothetical protein